MLFEETFEEGNFDNWLVEAQDEATIVEVKDGKMDITTPKGITIKKIREEIKERKVDETKREET